MMLAQHARPIPSAYCSPCPWWENVYNGQPCRQRLHVSKSLPLLTFSVSDTVLGIGMPVDEELASKGDDS